MTQESRPTVADHPFDLASALRRDEACVQFEDDLEAGLAPEIGQFLGRLPVPERPELFLELLGLELAYRRRNGEHPNPGEYQTRFAEFGSQIDAVFGGPRFSILGFHAAGGMGEVYRAYDQELHREVALKQIQERHAGDRNSRNRFIREAETTGRLQHPGIIPIYDRGHREEDGRPYYAMRFVEGASLLDAIARHHTDHPHPDPGTLEFRTLLQRFMDICNAIAFAHSRGILHRDLKPHNIMLGNYGEALIIDWGLARAATARSEAVDSANAAGAVLAAADGVDAPGVGYASGTPAYMSPEQARGDRKAIGLATDVYGLGTVLYQLLTGAAPVAGTSEAEINERVQTGAVTPPRTLNPRAPRSLEAVCQKALAPKPKDRYPTATALRQDVEHWLADEPVSVYRDPWTTRLLRWARKHRAKTMTAAGILITALAATAVVAAVKIEDNRQLRIAYGRLETANSKLAAGLKREQRLRTDVESRFGLAKKAIEAFHTGVSDDVHLKNPELKDLRDRLLHQALDFYKQLSAILKESDEREEVKRVEVAENLRHLAILTEDVGSPNDALAATAQALRLYEDICQGDQSDWALILKQAMMHHNLAAIHQKLGKPAEALTGLEAARQLLAGMSPTSSKDVSARSMLASVETSTGKMLFHLGRHSESLKHLELARAIRDALRREIPENAKNERDLAIILESVAENNFNMGAIVESLQRYEEANVILRRLCERNPGVREYESELATNLTHAADAHVRLCRPDKALPLVQEAIEICRNVANAYPTNADYRTDLARSYRGLASALLGNGRQHDAKNAYDQAIAIHQSLSDEHPDVPNYRADLIRALLGLGHYYQNAGGHDDAVRTYRTALKKAEPLAAENPKIPFYRAIVGETKRALAKELSADANTELLRIGDHTTSLALRLEACGIYGQLAGENPDVPTHQNEFAEGLAELGKFVGDLHPNDGLNQLQRAVTIDEKLVEKYPNTPDFSFSLACVYRYTGDVLKGYDSTHGSKPVDKEIEEAQTGFPGTQLRTSVQLDSAQLYYGKARDILNLLISAHPHDPLYQSELGAVLNNLGMIYDRELGRHEDALRLDLEAIDHQLIAHRLAPSAYQFRKFLSNHYANAATATRYLGRFGESIGFTRMRKAVFPDDPIELYFAAGDFGDIASAASKISSKPHDEVLAETKRYCDEAMSTLREAFDKGFIDFERMAENERINSLRAREDFQEFEREMLRYRARLFVRERDHDRALAEYKELIRRCDDLIQRKPQNGAAYGERGRAYAEIGDRKGAVADYNRAIELDPKDEWTHLNRASIHNLLGDYQSALADYEAAVRLNPGEPEAHNARGWLLATCPVAEHRDGKQAVESATRACELTRWENAGYVDTLAAAYAEAGDFAKAVEWQRKAVDLLPKESDERSELEGRLKLYENRTPYHEQPRAAARAS